MAKLPGLCIFCGGGGLTKEHVLPQWLQEILPKKFDGLRHELTRFPLPDGSTAPVHSSYRPLRQGDPLVRSLRVVCRSCNNGWMSRLQQSTKPILLPLVSDADWSGLTVSSQRTIAAWAAMTCIVFEQADPPTASIPQADRSYLMAQLEPPIERWTIWMARFEGAADREFWHTGLYYWPLDDAHPDVYDDEKGQLATFRVGQAMLRVLSIPKMVALDPRDESMILHGFARIWPPQEHPVRTLQPLNDADASNFHAGFRNSLFGTKIGKWD